MTTNNNNSRTSPHPLKGIVNTNDDPTRCARCHLCIDWYDDDGGIILTCCGKTLCTACDDEEGYSMALGPSGKHLLPFRCIFCREPATRGLSPKEIASRVKKRAKRGHAWAQFSLGCLHSDGELSVSQSSFEAKRWFEKAAKQNHPVAHLELDREIFEQRQSRQSIRESDLVNAKRHVDLALSLDPMQTSPSFLDDCIHFLVRVGQSYCDDAVANYEQLGNDAFVAKMGLAIQIIEPIAKSERERNSDPNRVQYFLGRAYGVMGNFAASREWCLSAFLANGYDKCMPAIGTLIYCRKMRLWAQVKFWDDVAKATPLLPTLSNDERGRRVMQLVQAKRDLRKIRGYCGFCGSSFSTTAERKLCRGCHALCYCSRDCQKMHWNRKENSHREDCKVAMEMKQKLKEARIQEDRAMKNDK